jgi:hypothetical protein
MYIYIYMYIHIYIFQIYVIAEGYDDVSHVDNFHSAQYLEDNPISDGVTFLPMVVTPDIYNTQTLKTELILSNDKETVIGKMFTCQYFCVFMDMNL